MKDVRTMADNELFDRRNELHMLLNREFTDQRTSSGSIVPKDWVATIEERDAALAEMHEIRLEVWRRGINAPTADKREDYIRYISNYERRLDNAIDSGDVARIYAAKDRLEVNMDSLNWIDGKEVL